VTGAAAPAWTSLQVFDDAEPRLAAMNMAIDEALLEHAQVRSLRFYRWRRPSLSFGYFGRYADARELGDERDLVRRWTGGGMVLHGSDLTYSIIIPKTSDDGIAGSRLVYEQIHETIRRVLSAGPAEIALAVTDAPKISDACFANPVTADVLVHGRKIAGAAQRRTRAGLLHQGSIQYEALPAGFPETFAAELCPRHTQINFTSQLLTRAEELAVTRYGSEAWLRRR